MKEIIMLLTCALFGGSFGFFFPNFKLWETFICCGLIGFLIAISWDNIWNFLTTKKNIKDIKDDNDKYKL